MKYTQYSALIVGTLIVGTGSGVEKGGGLVPVLCAPLLTASLDAYAEGLALVLVELLRILHKSYIHPLYIVL